jgi:hypothetical protein
MHILNLKENDFLVPADFKLLRQMEENSINNFDFLNAFNFCQGQLLLLLAPGDEKPS